MGSAGRGCGMALTGLARKVLTRAHLLVARRADAIGSGKPHEDVF
jgi:hypothetical protein